MKKRGSPDDNKFAASVSVVIPVFNNEKTIIEQLKKCQKILASVCTNYEIFISNDKSTDSTEKLLKQFPKDARIKVFHQPKNLGIAQNIRFLYQKAESKYLLLFSLDGGWDPQDIARLINHIHSQKADIVIGKRAIKDYPLQRKVISTIYNILPVILFQVRTHDTGSIKIFKKEILTNVSPRLTSVSFEAEMLIKSAKKGYTISAIPVAHKKHKENTNSGVTRSLVISACLDLFKLRLQGL